jgi:hypothetical protein
MIGFQRDEPVPIKPDAVRFVADAAASPDQLRRACEILGLLVKGGPETLRARLLKHLEPLDAAAPVACLNPRLEPASLKKPSQDER